MILAALAGIMADPLMAPVAWHVGKEFLDAQEPPPRIVFVPRTASYDAPDPHRMPASGPVNQRALYTRVIQVEAHIWQKGTPNADPPDDLDATEQLLNEFLAAGKRMAWGAFEPQGDAWELDDEPVVDLGRSVLLTFQLRVPVMEPSNLKAKVTSLPVTTQVG
jgi:hypothetical protein